MANWCLVCGRCGLAFAESVIADATLGNFLFPAKPTLPIGGKEFECPRCLRKAIYETSDYIYRA